MTFGDGHPWGAVPLLSPYGAHPEAPATAAPLASSLAGAYGFRRSHARQVGQAIFAATMQRLGSTHPPTASAAYTISQVIGYIPDIADEVLAEVLWVTTAAGQAEVICSVNAGSDSGAAASRVVGLDEAQGLSVLRGVPYSVHRAQAIVALSTATLDADVSCTVELGLQTVEDTPRVLPAWPLIVSVWWRCAG